MPPRNPRVVCRGAEKAGILVAIWEAYALLVWMKVGQNPHEQPLRHRAAVPLYGEFHALY